jgi:hypothetical protein
MDERPRLKPRGQRFPRILDEKRHHREPGNKQEILRDALREAARFLSPEDMLRVIDSVGLERPFTYKALGNFISNKTKTIDDDHYDILAKVWLRSSGGRSFRYLDTSDKPQFEKLANALASGQHLRPHGSKIMGNYFMYHGSYLVEDSYVIRLIEIDCIDDNILTVKDTINDNFHQRRELFAHGVVTFVKELPQLLFDADENKSGLSLIASTSTTFNAAKELASLTGAFLAVTNLPLVVERSCLLIREEREDRAAMIQQTGIFTREEIRNKVLAKHRAAFDRLSRKPPNRIFPDPILIYNRPDPIESQTPRSAT